MDTAPYHVGAPACSDFCSLRMADIPGAGHDTTANGQRDQHGKGAVPVRVKQTGRHERSPQSVNPNPGAGYDTTANGQRRHHDGAVPVRVKQIGRHERRPQSVNPKAAELEEEASGPTGFTSVQRTTASKHP